MILNYPVVDFISNCIDAGRTLIDPDYIANKYKPPFFAKKPGVSTVDASLKLNIRVGVIGVGMGKKSRVMGTA